MSPRGSLALDKCARVHAWMKGRDKVTIKDVQAVVHDVFRHRFVQTEHSKFNEITHDGIIDLILKQVPLPQGEQADEA